MNTYTIQHRLHTLSQPYINIGEGNPSFELNGFKFSQWDFNWAEGHKTQYWLIESQIKSEDFRTAFEAFRININAVIPKISMLSQCYAEHLNEPYIIHKNDSDIAFFRYTKKSNGVPLAFDGDNFKALEKLQNRQDIHDEFYYYWNDMLNVTGYSAKLLLLCSALEALAKSSINQCGNKYDFLASILGLELKDKIWEQKKGIRHRLMHGEYFSEITDKGSDYLGQAYTKIIEYFNNKILVENLIRNVTSPQRHPDLRPIK